VGIWTPSDENDKNWQDDPNEWEWIPLDQWHLNNGADPENIPKWVPVGEVIKWTVTFYVPNPTDNTWTEVILRDRFGAEIDHFDSHILGETDTSEFENHTTPADYGMVNFSYSKAKNMPQFRVTWNISTLNPHSMVTLSFDVVTRINKGQLRNLNKGKDFNWEYTSCGLQTLNSGANLKWQEEGLQNSMSTPPAYVYAWEEGCDEIGSVIGYFTDCEEMPIDPPKEIWLGYASTDEKITSVMTDERGFYHFKGVEVLPGDAYFIGIGAWVSCGTDCWEWVWEAKSLPFHINNGQFYEETYFNHYCPE
jgi:hypothetical protein